MSRQLKFAIMATDSRADLVEYMQSHLPEDQVEVFWDHDLRGHTWNWRRVIEYCGEGPCVMMEDDAILCVDFAAKAESLIRQNPNTVVQMFHRQKKYAAPGRNAMFPINGFYYNTAVYWPPPVARKITERFDETFHLDESNVKSQATDFWVQTAIPDLQMLVTNPPMVDHGIGKATPSVIGTQTGWGRSSSRQSPYFVDPELANYPRLSTEP